MELRGLTEADAEAFRRVRLRALEEHPEAFGRAPEEVESLEEIRQRLGTTGNGLGGFVLGAFEGPELVGIIGCQREMGIKQRHVAFIWGMYVAGQNRRRGLGRDLLEAAIARAKRWPGIDHIWLNVVTVNTAARELYRSAGFTAACLHRRAMKVADRYYDEERMVLDLR